MIENLVYIFVAFASIFIVVNAGETGFMNTRLKRSFAGSSLTYGGLAIIENYTNMFSFFEIAGKGIIGLGGYIFIAGSIALLLVWANNLLKTGQAIR